MDARRAEIAHLVDGLMERDTLDADEIRESFGIVTESVAA